MTGRCAHVISKKVIVLALFLKEKLGDIRLFFFFFYRQNVTKNTGAEISSENLFLWVNLDGKLVK